MVADLIKYGGWRFRPRNSVPLAWLSGRAVQWDAAARWEE